MDSRSFFGGAENENGYLFDKILCVPSHVMNAAGRLPRTRPHELLPLEIASVLNAFSQPQSWKEVPDTGVRTACGTTYYSLEDALHPLIRHGWQEYSAPSFYSCCARPKPRT